MSLIRDVALVARCRLSTYTARSEKAPSLRALQTRRLVQSRVSSFGRTQIRSYCITHPEHKPAVHLPTKEEEDATAPKRPERAVNIIGLTLKEMEEEFMHFGLPKYRATQVFQWLYGQGARSFDEMPTLGKKLISQLKEHYYVDSGTTSADSTSNDGTRKWLVDLGEKQCVETVFIPETKRGTLCVSSQIGCTMSCSFCHTGTQPLVRNLQAGEILTQVLTAKRMMYDFPRRNERVVSNIVFMGQGEPFYNYRNVKKAIDIITDSAGIAISKRRITVSTSGIVPNIKRLGDDFPGINLAISLHAVTDELRSAIVPANRQWPLSELIAACKAFPGLAPMRRIAFEYVMLKGINDSEADARELVRLLGDFPSFVNIIPFNPWPGSVYETSSNNAIMRFAKIITDAGIDAPIRWPRGRDILAACGQLKTETTKKRAAAQTSASNSACAKAASAATPQQQENQSGSPTQTEQGHVSL